MLRMLLFALFLVLFHSTAFHPALAQTTVFEETFDGVFEPELPATVLSSSGSWSTSTSSESAGSGGNNLRHGGTAAGDIVFGPVDLRNASGAEVRYLARRTSSYPADSLELSISADGGLTWSMLVGPGAALPVETSEYAAVTASLPDSIAAGHVIRLRFRAYGGSSSGSNIRLDDVTVSAVVDLSEVNDTFGFQSGSSMSDGSQASLPLDLAWSGPDSIQGLQFDVEFDTSLLTLSDVVPGSPVSSPGWTVDHSVAGGSARILLLGGDIDVIPSGLYSGLLSLEFQPNGSAVGSAFDSLTTVSLGDLIVSAYDPGGQELPIVLHPADHALTIDVGQAEISVSADSLSLGPTPIGSSATGTMTVTNPSGDGELVVSDVTFPSALFSASPGSFSVPPGGSVDVDVSFSPTETEFGFFSTIVTLSHNAPSSVTTVAVSATGTGGRGDITSDGIVDVGDVVAGIDAVLERTDPAAALATIDLHPFPTGNEGIDVRDLTVLVHAIMNTEWPDALPLPEPTPGVNAFGKRGEAAIELTDAPNAGTVLTLHPEIPLRGVQIELVGLDGEPVAFVDSTDPMADAAGSGTAVTRSAYNAEEGRYVYLAASAHLALERTEGLEIRNLPTGFGRENIAAVVGISDSFERVAMTVTDLRQNPGEHPEATRLSINVYPNPVRSGRKATIRMIRMESRDGSRINSQDPTGVIRVVDLLGREVTVRKFESVDNTVMIDTTPLLPGVYFIRVQSGDSITSTPLTIVR